jgi:exoribonuclease-2
MTLDVNGTVIERLDAVQGNADQPAPDEEDGEDIAGPIAIAVDVSDAEAGSGDNPAP